MNNQPTTPTSPSSPIQRPESPVRCPICMESLSTHIARFMPCGHEIDFDCAIQLLTGLEKTSRRCPLCRAKVIQVTWNHSPEGSYDFYVIGSGIEDRGPFIRDDEAIQGHMDESERVRRRELRRLRTLENFRPLVLHMRWGSFAKEAENYVLMQRELVLTAIQIEGIHTVNKLFRKVSLRTIPVSEVEEHPTAKPQNDKINAAKEEVETILSKYTANDLPFRALNHEEPVISIARDSRNLFAELKRSTKITRRSDERIEGIDVSTDLALDEHFVIEPNSAREIKDAGVVDGFTRQARQRALNLARQEIQCVWDYFRKGQHRLFPQFRELDEGSTATRQEFPKAELECLWCGEIEGHRNGECVMPPPAEDANLKLIDRRARHGLELGEDDDGEQEEIELFEDSEEDEEDEEEGDDYDDIFIDTD